MEGDHGLDLRIFRNNPNYNWEVSSSSGSYYTTSCSFCQQPSPSPYPHLPSPKPRTRPPGGRGRRAWTPWTPLVLGTSMVKHTFLYSPSGTSLSVVLHSAADRSCVSRILEADWL